MKETKHETPKQESYINSITKIPFTFINFILITISLVIAFILKTVLTVCNNMKIYIIEKPISLTKSIIITTLYPLEWLRNKLNPFSN